MTFFFLNIKILGVDVLNNTRNKKGYCNFTAAKTAWQRGDVF